MGRSECVPARLAALLRETGRTAAELSSATEIPAATIRGYLGGGRNTISTRNLLLIAQFFQMPMSELMDRLAAPSLPSIDNADKVSGQNSSF